MIDNKKSKILFHYLPPAMSTIPSPAFSVLKSFLANHSYESEIIYWNKMIYEAIMSDLNIISTISGDWNFEALLLMPFLFEISCKMDSHITSERILSLFQSFSHDYSIYGSDSDVERLNKLKEKIFQRIDSKIAEIDMENVALVGFSAKFLQWISGLTTAKKVKRLHPGVKVVIGGFGNREEAVEMLRMGPEFDFAIWGEGEYPLLELLRRIESGGHIDDLRSVPRLVYRDEEGLTVTAPHGRYIQLENYISPDFSDFFEIGNRESIKNIYFPIEASRGCHWNRCKFCFLNEGYKFRVRPHQNIIREIESLYAKFQINQVLFVDSDIAGPDKEAFEAFLDSLIESALKNRVKYRIHAEVVHHGFSAAIIQKMAIAGFSHVQIGYEAITDNLLKKMNKKVDFADHILFLKYSNKYGIEVIGTNIIRGIIGETVTDVLESINNLPFLRLYLNDSPGKLHHTMTKLRLKSGSEFFNMVDPGEREKWNFNPIVHLLPATFIDIEKRFALFSFTCNLENKVEWNHFETVNDFYQRSRFTYQILERDGVCFYSEFMDSQQIKYIVFNEPQHWAVLKVANEEVVSLAKIFQRLNEQFPDLTKEQLVKIIHQLKTSHLIYANEDLTRIVSVIDTQQ
jgi:radical SAM superfamily enzyme YgiQ (UPF0313 family)